jgi:hypothetical protein
VSRLRHGFRKIAWGIGLWSNVARQKLRTRRRSPTRSSPQSVCNTFWWPFTSVTVSRSVGTECAVRLEPAFFGKSSAWPCWNSACGSLNTVTRSRKSQLVTYVGTCISTASRFGLLGGRWTWRSYCLPLTPYILGGRIKKPRSEDCSDTGDVTYGSFLYATGLCTYKSTR